MSVLESKPAPVALGDASHCDVTTDLIHFQRYDIEPLDLKKKKSQIIDKYNR